MKIDAVHQQDAVTVEADEGNVLISQVDSSCGREDVITVSGKSNVDDLIAALQKAREALK